MIYTRQNTIDIGKPARVYVNRKLIETAIVADTEKGEVIYYPKPFRVGQSGDEIHTETLRGTVTVEFI